MELFSEQTISFADGDAKLDSSVSYYEYFLRVSAINPKAISHIYLGKCGEFIIASLSKEQPYN